MTASDPLCDHGIGTNQVTAKGSITTGQLVVATLKGKRLAYATADGGTGKVKLFAAKFPTCS